MQKRPLETINREQVEPSLGFQIDSDELRKVREAAGEAGLTGYEFWKLLPVGGASGPANFRKTAPSRSQVKTMLANLRVLRASAAGGGKRGKLPGNLETKHEMHCASLDEAISRAETYSARMDDDYNDRSGLATRGSVQASSRTKIRNRIRAFRTEALCSGLRCHACHLIHFGRTEEALIRIEEAEKAWASSSGSALSQVTMGFYIQLIKAEAYFRSTAKLDRTDKSNARRAVKKAYDLLKEHTLLRRGGRSIRSADVVAPLWEAILHHLRAVFLFEGDPKEQLDTLATAKSYLVRSDNGGCFRSRKSLEADIERLERQLSEQLR